MKRRPKGSHGGSKAATGRRRLGDVIVLISRLVALVILAAILLFVLEANAGNDVVQVVYDVAAFLVGPFEQLFTIDDRQAEVAVNYGIAAIVYLVVGRIVGGLIRP